MPTLIPTTILDTKPFQTAHGQLYAVRMSGTLDGTPEPIISINVKDPNNTPPLNVPLQVDIKDRNAYGVSVKKSPPPLPQATAPITGVPQNPLTPAPEAPQRAPYVPYDKSSEREYIVRQNSLTNAVAYCTAKASLMTKEKGEKYLEGKKIIEVAHYFNKYSMGDIPFPTSEKPGSEVFAERNTEEEPLPEEPDLSAFDEE